MPTCKKSQSKPRKTEIERLLFGEAFQDPEAVSRLQGKWRVCRPREEQQSSPTASGGVQFQHVQFTAGRPPHAKWPWGRKESLVASQTSVRGNRLRLCPIQRGPGRGTVCPSTTSQALLLLLCRGVVTLGELLPRDTLQVEPWSGSESGQALVNFLFRVVLNSYTTLCRSSSLASLSGK